MIITRLNKCKHNTSVHSIFQLQLKAAARATLPPQLMRLQLLQRRLHLYCIYRRIDPSMALMPPGKGAKAVVADFVI